MRKWLLTLRDAASLETSAAARAADPPKDDAKSKKPDVAGGHQQAARGCAHDRLRHERGHVDVGGRLAGRHRRWSSTCSATSTPCPIAGGTATALTSGPAYDCTRASPPTARRSRSRATAAASRTSGSWTPTASNPRAVTAEKDAYVRSAAWTPDGNYLIARKEDGKRAGIPPVELWIYHREGGGGIKLTVFGRRQQRGRRGRLARRPLHLLLGAAAQVQLHPGPEGRALADLALRPRARRHLPGRGAASAARCGRRSRPTARR